MPLYCHGKNGSETTKNKQKLFFFPKINRANFKEEVTLYLIFGTIGIQEGCEKKQNGGKAFQVRK